MKLTLPTLPWRRGLPKTYLPAIEEDELIWEIQAAAQPFYQSIWHSLNAREKYILFDLAEDGLLNLHDGLSLRMLMKKGLIIRDRETWQLRLFNKSFRNFVLTVISTLEAEKIQNEIKDGWQWSHLKTPMLILVLAIMAFMLISQYQTYARVFTVLSSLAAIIPLINALTGAFKGEK